MNTYIATAVWDGMDGGQKSILMKPIFVIAETPEEAYIRAGAIFLTLEYIDNGEEPENVIDVLTLIDLSNDEEGIRYHLFSVEIPKRPIFEKAYKPEYYAEIEAYIKEKEIDIMQYIN